MEISAHATVAARHATQRSHAPGPAGAGGPGVRERQAVGSPPAVLRH